MTEEILSLKRLNRALLARQMLLQRVDLPLPAVVGQLVALQAQQTRPPFIGLWSRLAGFEPETLLQALRSHALVRATFLRGTLHLLNAADYAAFRASLQPGLTMGMNAILKDRVKDLDTAAVLKVAREFILKQPRTFTEVRDALIQRFPQGDERAMGYFVRTHLPLVMVPDESEWGFPGDSAFALAEERLGKPIAKTEQTHELILRYLAAFGPATAADVQAWSGLAAIKPVLDSLRPRLKVFRDEKKRELFDHPEAPRPEEDTPAPVRFIADFDNLILSHKERGRIIADEHRPRVTTRNLLVLPTFLVDGFVAGTWKVERMKKNAVLTLSPFRKLGSRHKAELEAEGKSLARFVERETEKIEVRFAAASK